MTSKPPEQDSILIIDDTPGELEALITFLKMAGFRVMVARNSVMALKQIEEAPPDLILLDVLMPGMDGFEICRHIKECDVEIPVIFMTAFAENGMKVKGFQAGGVDYLTKPLQLKEVLARVNVHLTIRKLQQQLRKENERFHILAEATFEGIVIHDEGRILEANQRLCTLFAYQRAEVLGKHVLGFVAPESRKIVLEHIHMEDNHPYEAQGLKKDGTIFPIEIQASSLPYKGRMVRVASVRDLSWQRALEDEKQELLNATIQDRYKLGEIIGKSQVMQKVYHTIVNVSASHANVVIYGESGTGKELVARTIHAMSERREQAFVPVNCGAVPESLFEREFFGHRKGAFTGAIMDKAGYLDRAHQGTLFLDEVGELGLSMQVKLLRVLQENEYIPLGDTCSKTVDIRIIAATNKDLTAQLQQGAIREDFFYRIRVIVINLPPLRERKEDIPLLVEHFLKQYGNHKDCLALPVRIAEALCAYDWPGNVRELQNELQRYLAEQRLEFVGHVLAEPAECDRENGWEGNSQGMTLWEAIETLEKSMILNALNQNGGKQGKAAKILGISEKTLYNKMRKYGLKNYSNPT